MYWNEIIDGALIRMFEATPGGRLFYLVLLLVFFFSSVALLNWSNARSERKAKAYEEQLRKEYERKRPIGSYYWMTGEVHSQRRKG